MSKKTIVTFVKPWQGYGPDEIAGFDKDKAEALVEAGIAKLHSGKKGTAKQEQKSGAENTTAQSDQQQSDTSSAADTDSDAKP